LASKVSSVPSKRPHTSPITASSSSQDGAGGALGAPSADHTGTGSGSNTNPSRLGGGKRKSPENPSSGRKLTHRSETRACSPTPNATWTAVAKGATAIDEEG